MHRKPDHLETGTLGNENTWKPRHLETDPPATPTPSYGGKRVFLSSGLVYE